MSADALVSFIGAGPGAPDLLTIRARQRIEQADVVIYADSLVQPAIAAYARDGAAVHGSAKLTMEETMGLILEAVRDGKRVARVQSGDPSIYGAIHEQIVALQSAGVSYEIVPGVSSAFAAAAVLGIELTVPEVAQTVIFTRLSGRTSVPEGERLRDLARHGASVAIFLSIPMIERVVEELRAGGYTDETPAAVVYRVSWSDELVLQGTLADIAGKTKAAGLQLQALILVGPALASASSHAKQRSNLYNPKFTQRHRRASIPEPEPEP